MPTGPRLLLNNVCYHISTRGNQRQKVFLQDKDFVSYLIRLKRYKLNYNFTLYAYCLMPNHVHLLGEISNPPNLSLFMHDLNRSYTAYFNAKYRKVGYLWQGRFKSYIVYKDQYILNCMNYIELNPVRAKLVNNPLDYQYSSYKERFLGYSDFPLIDPLTL